MVNKMLNNFLEHRYRYLDQTGGGRSPISSNTVRDDLNQKEKYDAYFTVNGFAGNGDRRRESLTHLNAFFCDIDGRKDMDEVERIKKLLDPTFIVETKNGHHFYWLLDEPILKDEVENWEEITVEWDRIEQNIVKTLKGDTNAMDICRVLRQPDSIYWKKTDGSFRIKVIYENMANRYSMKQVDTIFPTAPTALQNNTKDFSPTNEKQKKFADAEKKDFFDKVNEAYPIAERNSFKLLISGLPGTLPPNIHSRNKALLVTASLMRQAKWSMEDSYKHIMKVGWHGIESERGGDQEIFNTIKSAFGSEYTFSYKEEVIAYNTSHEEQMKMSAVYTAVAKARRETDKVRFSNYEQELFARYPYLKKNEVGIVYNYRDGVYYELSDQEVSNIVLNGLYEDMLWGFRNRKAVSDKVACLLSIIPDFEITNDRGVIANVKNGLLNIATLELQPHTPNFVSLIQYPVVYDPTAKCPIWDICIDNWMEGEEKEEKKRLLKQFSGYSLSSSMLYDRALFLVGDGGNGKSTFVDTIAMVIGHDATSHIDLESLYAQYGMKGLMGKRLNIIEEVHGNYYQSNKLKKLISGEKVTIDVKYKDQFTFRPQAKFVFAVNQMPRVDDTSTATERRICAIHFKNNFRDNPNRQLRSDMGLLAKELSGILNWMLEGAKDLRNNEKFITTKEQTQMLSEYRQENSSVEGFIGECLVYEPGVVTDARDLYDSYRKWCDGDGRKAKSNIAFAKEMRAYGTRFDKFTFIERVNGHDGAKFKGVKVDSKIPSSLSMTQRLKEF